MTDTQYSIPYVLFINKQGQGFTLDRGYHLLHETLDVFGRHRVKGLLPLAKQKEVGYSITGEKQIPNWCRRINRNGGRVSYYVKGFTAYWFTDQFTKGHDKVKQACESPRFNKGIALHYDKVSSVQNELKNAKREQRNDIIKCYREEHGIRKPFFNDGSIRFYLHHESDELQAVCAGWNDNWWTAERFTQKELLSACKSMKEFLERESCTGTFHISLEGSYGACASFEEAEASCYEHWSEYFEVNNVATLTI